MNLNEFYSEFNLVYNNLASNQAAGLDKYEIGVYLTKAEETLTDALYAEFEKSEEARRKLAPLVITKKPSKVQISSDSIIYPKYTTTFDKLTDIRYIIYEKVKLGNTGDRCTKNKELKVQPILHDEIDSIIDNPFKFNSRRALRLDTAEQQPYIEILTKASPVDYYQVRYVKNPEPIILEDLTGTNDYINRKQKASIGSLPEVTHRQIVEIAAKMAYQDYKN